ncbi:chemotaxis-specific protein-glutamate methyltransferase CheB [Ancylobacter sp. G4_0304]|uniref:chemotaxis-specific protein-glutamate methyltransferase CheB n=1 Tax=Ancylobacter sp. G4_0304 TaxID=3114289 RepID=UPI0039C68C7A
MNGAREIRVLLVEDSRSQRETLAWVIGTSRRLKLVGEAENGARAVEMTASLAPDIILMDCHMPVMDGIAATREIMTRHPTPIIMTSATSDTGDIHPGLEALRLGALAIVPKPLDPTDASFDRTAAELCLTLEMLADVKVRRAPPIVPEPPALAPAREAPMPGRPRKDIRIIAIGASTGGPPVVMQILRLCAADLVVPVIVAQHMCAGFISGFASWLDRGAGIPVEVARDGGTAMPGRVYVAPEGGHLAIDSTGRFRVEDGAPENGFRPSISHLFRSVADSYGPHALGVLLTGMGQDGADGLLSIVHRGGTSVVQDRESSVVFGMPNAAIQRGAAQRILPPKGIARFIVGQMATRGLHT